MKRSLFHILILMFLAHPLIGQEIDNIVRIKNKRIAYIDFQHLGVGTEASMRDNMYLGYKVFYGVGSYRNLINADLGIRYAICNPFITRSLCVFSVQFFSLFTSVNVNFARWKHGSVYIGGELSYNIVTSAYYNLFPSSYIYDNKIGKNHGETRGKFGIKLKHWDVYFYLDYNMAPAMNQKYVYESKDYDYYIMSQYLFERYRLGISISYLLNIGR